MRSLRLTPSGLVQDDNYPIPEVSDHEALVRVSLAGICSTDLEIVKGYFGFQGVLGHEFVGKVVSAADPSWVGRRVVSSINFANPRSDEFAKFGFEHHPRRTVLGILGHDGAMADYVCVPMANLYEVPSELADEQAVFAEPLAAALRIRQQIIAGPDAKACVLGPGRLGMLVAKVLSLGGTEVVIAGRSDGSLQLARQWSLATARSDQLPDSSFDIVVDATGHPTGLEQAIRLTQPLGTLVLKSTFAETPRINLTKIVVDEITVVGSRCGPFAPALRMLAAAQVDVASLVDGKYPIEQAMQAFEHAARPGTRKILLRFDS